MTVQQVRTQFITDYSNKGVRAFQRDLNTLGHSANKVGDDAGRGLGKIAKFSQAAGTALMVGVGAALAVGIKASIDFEDAFAGVRKTVDASEGTFQRLAREIRDLALEIPVAATELAKIGELGGQLGVPTDALDDFIEVIAKLGVTTNLQTEEAATAVARFSEIMGSTDSEFENIASSLVDLGNNFATTEKEILNFGTRLAGIGSTVGMTEGDVLGLATAFTHLGEPAERGATAVQRAFVSMFQAVNQGGEDLKTFAEVVGVTSTEFITMFEEDPTQAFIAFAEGLNEIIESGGDVTSMLQDLGLGSQRTLGAMLKAATGFDILEDAVRTGNRAFDENIALNEEAEERFGTMQSQIELLKNQFMELRLEIGDRATPAFKDLLGFMGGFFRVVGDNIGILEKLFAVILLFTGVKGLVAVGRLAAGAAVGLGEMSTKMTGLGVAGLNAQTRLAKVGTVVRGLGGVIGAATIALGLLAVAFGRNEQHAQAYRDAIENTLDTLDDFREGTVHAQEVYEAFVEVLAQKTGIFDLPLDLEEYRDFVSDFGITTRELVDLAVHDFDEFERRTSEITDSIKAQMEDTREVTGRGTGFVGPSPEDQERLRQLNTWQRIITEVTVATKNLREEEELRRKEQEIEGRARATAPGGPGAAGLGGPSLDFMEGVSSAAADIAFGIITTRDEYNEALADMISDTKEFTQDFAEEWGEIVGEFNESLFDWETAWDEYESVAALSTSELDASIGRFIEDQRNRTAALAFVYGEFGEEVGALFASLPAELQLRLGATLDELGPEAFRSQIDSIVEGWGDMQAMALENAMIMAPTGARRAFESFTEVFSELMTDMPEHAEVGSQAWQDAVMANFEEFRLGLAEERPELSAAFDDLIEQALEELDQDRPLIDLEETIAGMTTEEKIQKFRDMGLSWVEAIMLAFGTLPEKMGDVASGGAAAVAEKFPEGIEISSPSKLFMRFGEFAARGFEMGFQNSLDKISFKPNQPVVRVEAPQQTPANGPSIVINNPQHKDDDIMDGLQRASTLVGLTRMAEITRN